MIAGPKASKMRTRPLFTNWPTETILALDHFHFSGLIAFLLLYSASSNSNTSSDLVKDTFEEKLKIMTRICVTKIVLSKCFKYGHLASLEE